MIGECKACGKPLEFISKKCVYCKGEVPKDDNADAQSRIRKSRNLKIDIAMIIQREMGEYASRYSDHLKRVDYSDGFGWAVFALPSHTCADKILELIDETKKLIRLGLIK